MTTYIDARYVSAELKRRLTAEFPGVRFSVRRGRGTGSAGIDVTWTDGPTDRDVAAIAKPMQGSSWNGWADRYEDTGNEVTVTIDGKRVTGKPVVDSIALHQEVSEEVRAEARALWDAANPGEEPCATNGGFTCEGEFIGGTWGVNQVLDIAQKVILPRRWKAAQQAAAVAAPASAVPAEPAPAALFGEALDVTHTEKEGVVVRGTRRGDGSAPVLRAEGLKWNRRDGYWFLPGSRGAAGAERLDGIRAALRTAGLFPVPAGALETADAPGEEEPVEELPAAAPAEDVPAEERSPLLPAAELEELAARLLDDVGLRDADVFHVISNRGDVPPLQTRAEAVRFVAGQLEFGASHHWHEGELRLASGGRTLAYVKPAPAPLPGEGPVPAAYRGVPVPPHIAGAWRDPATGGVWREGVDAALAYAVLAPAAD